MKKKAIDCSESELITYINSMHFGNVFAIEYDDTNQDITFYDCEQCITCLNYNELVEVKE